VPNTQNKRALFIRWLWLVYLPLGLLVVALPLMFFGVLTGGMVWLVGLLAAYCVVPMRLLLETRRKGLGLPRPPGASSPRRPVPPPGPARSVDPDGPPGVHHPGDGPPGVQPARSGTFPADEVSTARLDRPPVPARIKRRRAVAGVMGVGVMSLLGGLLFILGMGRASSGTFGLLLIGIGGFLMLLSVTLPTFKIVDLVVRAVGRLVSKKPRASAKPAPNRSRPERAE